ncbi:MAG: acyl-CoA synthetase [Burkholderiales bacterium]|nr:acyl-CoA synthetase [Burkholderiales bacterium]
MPAISSFPLRTLADIEAFEREQPFERRCPARSVYDVFRESAARHPDQTALTMILSGAPDENPRTVSYAELLSGIHRAANFFRDIAGPRPGVAYMLPSLIETHFALWGAEAAGYAVPINFLLTAEHIVQLLRAADVRVLVALGPHPQLDIWEKAQAVAAQLPSLKLVRVGAPGSESAEGSIDFAAGLKAQDGDRLCFSDVGQDDDVAAYFHTGGTTGAPKLVTHTHRNQIVAAFGGAALLDIRDTDTMANGLPLFHVAGTIFGGLSHFMVGARILILSPAGMRNPEMIRRFWQIIEQYRVTIGGGIPTVMTALLTVPVDADLSSVRLNVSGAAAAPKALVEQFEAHTGRPVHEILGMTECGGLIALNPAAGKRVIGSVGLRIPYIRTEVRRLGADGSLGATCAPYEIGVLTVHGPIVTPGYRRAEDNDSALHRGYVNTGDLAYTDEEERIYIAGRAKDLIIRSGHNIDPQQIEEAVQRHPAVAAAAAVGQPDRYAGELPVCYVTLKPSAQVTTEELRIFSEPLLAERPAWPKQYYIVDAIPVTGVGKIFKPALRTDAVQRLVAQVVKGAIGCEGVRITAVPGGKRGMDVTIVLGDRDWERRAELRTALDGYLFYCNIIKA